jgi:hypothetical protein
LSWVGATLVAAMLSLGRVDRISLGDVTKMLQNTKRKKKCTVIFFIVLFSRKRVTGEEWLVKKPGAYLRGVWEEVGNK